MYCCVPFRSMVAVTGVTSTATTFGGSTVTGAGALVIAPRVAVMFELPCATPVARPVESIVTLVPVCSVYRLASASIALSWPRDWFR